MEPVRGQIGMDPRQRFRLGLPHPVCGGHVGLPQGRSCASLTVGTRSAPGSCMPRRASGVSSAALDRLAALPRGHRRARRRFCLHR